jgi:hypothetical protein
MTPRAARTECPEPVLTGSGQAGIDDRTGTVENGGQVLIEAIDFKSPIFRAARKTGHPRSSHASSLSHPPRGRAALERAGGRKNQKQIPLSARDDTRRSGEMFPATVPVFKSSHDPSTTLGMAAAERLGEGAQP